MDSSTEQLIRDYLNRIAVAARSSMDPDEVRAFLGRMHDSIERQCAAFGGPSTAEVSSALAAMGEPAALVGRERARLAAARAGLGSGSPATGSPASAAAAAGTDSPPGGPAAAKAAAAVATGILPSAQRTGEAGPGDSGGRTLRFPGKTRRSAGRRSGQPGAEAGPGADPVSAPTASQRTVQRRSVTARRKPAEILIDGPAAAKNAARPRGLQGRDSPVLLPLKRNTYSTQDPLDDPAPWRAAQPDPADQPGMARAFVLEPPQDPQTNVVAPPKFQPVREPVAWPASSPARSRGPETGTEPGTDLDSEQDSEPGTEPGTEQDSEPGTEPDSEPGTELSSQPGTEAGPEPDSGHSAEQRAERDAELEADTDTPAEAAPQPGPGHGPEQDPGPGPGQRAERDAEPGPGRRPVRRAGPVPPARPGDRRPRRPAVTRAASGRMASRRTASSRIESTSIESTRRERVGASVSVFIQRAPGLARQHPLECIAVILLGLGGLIFPPVWLLGVLAALPSRLWDIRDKLTGLATPAMVTIVGGAGLAMSSHTSGTAYFHEAVIIGGYLIRAGSVLGAGYLAWRVQRGQRQPAEPPWRRQYR